VRWDGPKESLARRHSAPIPSRLRSGPAWLTGHGNGWKHLNSETETNKPASSLYALLLSAVSVDSSNVTPLWSGDFSGSSFEDVLRIEAENRAWHTRLRLEMTALVDSRLAKQISQEEYIVRRQCANEDAAECKRRGTILIYEIASRAGKRLYKTVADPHEPGRHLWP
jgi:hypothetical protein